MDILQLVVTGNRSPSNVQNLTHPKYCNKSNDSVSRCVKCQENHPSNFNGCITYFKQVEIKSRQTGAPFKPHKSYNIKDGNFLPLSSDNQQPTSPSHPHQDSSNSSQFPLKDVIQFTKELISSIDLSSVVTSLYGKFIIYLLNSPAMFLH